MEEEKQHLPYYAHSDQNETLQSLPPNQQTCIICTWESTCCGALHT